MPLCVYDKHTKQNEFDGCGLGIIKPKVFKTSETENGDYSVQIEYPINDTDRMWTYLSPYAIVKNSEGQLFQIHTCGTEMSSSGAVWKAQANHISYYLADKLVEGCVYNGIDCRDALNKIWEHTIVHSGDSPSSSMTEYDFTFNSDRVYRDWRDINYTGINPLYAILGSENSILNLYGGSIYRDNFYISVFEKKQYSKDDAFEIVHGINMTSITERLSVKDVITGFIAGNNFGIGFSTFNRTSDIAPHECIRRLKFSYSEDHGMDQLREDAYRYRDAHLNLDASYTVRFRELKNDPKYSDWAKLQRYRVGDRGWIKSERLGIKVYVTIVSRVLNDITGEVEEITLGTLMPNLWRNDRFSLSRDSADGRRLEAIERLRLNNMFKWEE